MNLDDALRYDMPANFGPSQLPDVTEYANTTAVGIAFTVEQSAIAALLPSFLEPADDPVVKVVHQMMHGVDYLGGRGYNITSVSLAAVHPASGREHDYSLVTWENDTNPIVAGREFLGTPKLYAEISDLADDGGRRRFTCSEYGTPLIDGEVWDLKPVSPSRIKQMNAQPRDVVSFGWKYIPRAGGGADADYGTTVHMRIAYTAMAVGEGRHRFHRPAWEDAPISSRIMAALADLTVLDHRAAFYVEGPATLDRRATCILSRSVNGTVDQGQSA